MFYEVFGRLVEAFAYFIFAILFATLILGVLVATGIVQSTGR